MLKVCRRAVVRVLQICLWYSEACDTDQDLLCLPVQGLLCPVHMHVACVWLTFLASPFRLSSRLSCGQSLGWRIPSHSGMRSRGKRGSRLSA